MSDLYKALDFYEVDELYTEEERMVRDAVRSWVSDRFMPVIEEHNRAGTFPTDLIPELGELGVFGATVASYTRGLPNDVYFQIGTGVTTAVASCLLSRQRDGEGL